MCEGLPSCGCEVEFGLCDAVFLLFNPIHVTGKLVLDGWVHFTAPARVGVLVRALRREMEALLAAKVATPGLDLAGSPVIEAILLLLRTDGI